jgi:hypothetical protein
LNNIKSISEEGLNKMKRLKNVRFMSFLLALLLVAVIAIAVPIMSTASDQPTVDLGNVANYAVLAYSGITNTGSTTISGDTNGIGGDIGSYPTPAITGFPPGTVTGGTIHEAADSATQLAQSALLTAYNDAAGRASDQNLSGTPNRQHTHHCIRQSNCP